jgi:transcriptional regulator of acetoin/glycerol metabolism
MRLATDSDLTMCWWHLSLAKNRVTRRRSNRSQTQNLSLQVLELEETVAASDSTVLLLGETGTGKELIARALHDRSRRKQRTLVKLNCAAIPSRLLESELFGHEPVPERPLLPAQCFSHPHSSLVRTAPRHVRVSNGRPSSHG